MEVQQSQPLLSEKPRHDTWRFFLIVIIILIFGSATILIGGKRFSQRSANLPKDPSIISPVQEKIAKGTLTMVYGSLEGEEAVIHAINTDGTNDAIVARLPQTIKDIHVINPSQFLFISDTDDHDFGSKIEIYDLKSQTSTPVYTVKKPWSIDDVIVSSDNTWISWQELRLGSNGTLQNGKSRIYSAEISSPSAQLVTHLLFDEDVTTKTPIHKPIFFDHNSNLYARGIIPMGGGWNHGVVRVTSTGGEPTEVLADGTFIGNIVLAPDRDVIAFTSFESGNTPAFGSDDASVSGLLATNSVNPNTIKFLDLSTDTPRTLLSEPGRVYYNLMWDSKGMSVTAMSFVVDQQHPKDGQIVIVQSDTGVSRLVSKNPEMFGWNLIYTSDGVLVGKPAESGGVSSLGDTYTPEFISIDNYPDFGKLTNAMVPSIHLAGSMKNLLTLQQGSSILGTQNEASTASMLSGENTQFIAVIPRDEKKKLGLITSLSVEKRDNVSKLPVSSKLKLELLARPAQQNDAPKLLCIEALSNLALPGNQLGDTEQKALFQTALLPLIYTCYR